jgi:chitin disaccharide deacetylase
MSEAGSGVGPGTLRRNLVLCADDYAMNAGVSEGILHLAEAGRVSATSCLTNAPGWKDQAAALKPFVGRIGIGLHLTLTWGAPLGHMPRLAPDGTFPHLGEVMRAAFRGKLDAPELEAQIEQQLGAFITATGRNPDFVDGHQHVHVLPVVRTALLSVLVRRRMAGEVWLRDCADRVTSIVSRRLSMPKALLVSGLSAGFGRSATEAGFTTNAGFSGFSAFDPRRSVERDFERHLSGLGARPLVMCHPGLPDPADPGEEIAAAREREYAYLSSEAFSALLEARGLSLAPAPA